MDTVLVCGSRTWMYESVVWKTLNRYAGSRLRTDGSGLRLIHGKCPRGADQFADNWGRSMGHRVLIQTYAADWKSFGRRAGVLRNQFMLDDSKPDIVLAFWDGKSLGTLDMIKRATWCGVPVRIIPEKEVVSCPYRS